jgi:transposase
MRPGCWSEVGDITRFPNNAHFASWNGTAPIDASSGDQIRHRLSRARNPSDLPSAAPHGHRPTAQRHARGGVLRPPQGRRQDLDEGDASAKKRRLSDIVYRQMLADALTSPAIAGTGPEGHPGATTGSRRPTHTPTSTLRRRHFPDPPLTTLGPPSRPLLDTEGSHERVNPTPTTRAGAAPPWAPSWEVSRQRHLHMSLRKFCTVCPISR